jgi:hypothetical protein
MDSAELLQPLPTSDSSLCLLLLELRLIRTPLNSSGPFSQAGSVNLSKTLIPMDLVGAGLWTLMDFSVLFSRAGSVILS